MAEINTDKEFRQKLLEQRRRAYGEKVALLEHLAQEFGQPLIDAVEKYYGDDIEKEFAGKAAALPERDVAGLCKILWEPMLADGIEYVVEERDDGVQFRVTKCPWYEYAKAAKEFAGGADTFKWSYHMLCCNDPYITRGFNPEWTFTRTKTLMQGHDCCDHYYHFKRNPR